ncbi:hypothetical protein CAPTEDRAFT_153114 [Capitella teleta]|uniref:CutA1 divalent ion tolerance protein n=1 Tax=Capitella teleta TaxID=283909 RepID=R7UTX7_CAPTE|nr:hypothetical protein CAPTEDRAFT_153114 [Capitella teleta]|eukprot:ELU09979.1 hypothetical protein CAPTEDRAFT_153114 [Capitella teleta]
MAGEFSVAFVTVPSMHSAKDIARGLVEGRLAACVNIIPNLRSIYIWQGEIQEDAELLLLIKTRTSRVPDMTEYVKEKHPFDLCEVIATPIESGNAPYLNWIGESVPALNPNKNMKNIENQSDSYNGQNAEIDN